MSVERRVDTYAASDYAGMNVGPWSFYYGYEFARRPSEDEPGEEVDVWGFTARHGDLLVASLSFEQLCVAARQALAEDDVTDNLLVGIGLCLRNGAFA